MQKVSHAIGKGARFAGTGSSKDETGSFRRCHCLILFVIQLRSKIDGRQVCGDRRFGEVLERRKSHVGTSIRKRWQDEVSSSVPELRSQHHHCIAMDDFKAATAGKDTLDVRGAQAGNLL